MGQTESNCCGSNRLKDLAGKSIKDPLVLQLWKDALLEALRSGDTDFVKSTVNNIPTLVSETELYTQERQTALEIACFRSPNPVSNMEILFKAGVDPAQRTGHPIQYVDRRNIEISLSPLTCFERACTDAKLDVVRHFLSEGVDANLGMIQSCFFGHLVVVSILLENGASATEVSVNARESTPLTAASKGGDPRVVSLLIKNGADPNFIISSPHNSASGADPIHQMLFVCLLFECHFIVPYLFYPLYSGLAPLHIAAFHSNVRLAQVGLV